MRKSSNRQFATVVVKPGIAAVPSCSGLPLTTCGEHRGTGGELCRGQHAALRCAIRVQTAKYTSKLRRCGVCTKANAAPAHDLPDRSMDAEKPAGICGTVAFACNPEMYLAGKKPQPLSRTISQADQKRTCGDRHYK
jgi:hypothetical protein